MTSTRSVMVGTLHVRVVSPATSTARGAVVLVHGVCLSGIIWTRWAEKLASRGIEAWCMDLRGHGDSEGAEHVGSARIEEYAADVEAVVMASGAVGIVGHDMGGLLAQIVAARVQLRGVVLVSSIAPKGISGRSTMQLLWREFRPRYIRAILRGKPWRPAEDDARLLLCRRVPAEEQEQVLSWLTRESGTAAREMLISGVQIEEASIKCPVFVVSCTQDELTPPARQRQIAQRYHGDYVEFAQHAHFPMLEPGWERPVAVVGRWLEEAARIGDRVSASRLAARRSSTDTPTPLPIRIVDIPTSASGTPLPLHGPASGSKIVASIPTPDASPAAPAPPSDATIPNEPSRER